MPAILPWVSHGLERARLLGDYRAGRIDESAVHDADFLLVAAANFHGYPTDKVCPICDEPGLRTVYWVHGDGLGRRTNTARSLEEIDEFSRQGLTFDLHEVEVCPACKWNFLMRTTMVLPQESPQREPKE